MDYTQSNSFFTDAGTTQRMHLSAQAVTTMVSDNDMNMLIWEVMEVVKASGQVGVPFDKAVPATYQTMVKALKRIFGGNVTTINFAASPFALTADHAGLVLVDAAAGNVVVNLPAVNVLAKLTYTLRRVDVAATTVTINRAGANTIDEGLTSFALLGQGDIRQLASDGVTTWRTIGASGAGRLLGIQVFTASGTYTPTPGTTKIKIRVQGAGGAGGGTPSTVTGSVAGGLGGTAGAYAESFIASGFNGAAVTVGAGGAGALGAAGGNGGTSSFGALVSAPGGTGGLVGVGAVPPYLLGFGNNSAAATGGTLLNQAGSGGGPALQMAVGAFVSGSGGSSALGPGAPSAGSANFNGNAAVSRGAGGSGASAASGNPASQAGGNGANGVVIIEELA